MLGLLERSRILAPRLVAADPDAVACDVPALLVTRLAGRSPGPVRKMESFLRQLVEVLVRIHDVALDDANVIPMGPMCSFQNVVVNNEADLWIITRLARANDELGAI